MGTWGHNAFDNDAAMDFMWEVEEEGVSKIMEMIDKAASFPADEYHEEGEETMAALEYIAAAKGKPGPELPEEVEEWLESEEGKKLIKDISSSDLINKCLKALHRIKTGEGLKTSWDDDGADEPEKWYQALDDLEKRLRS